MSDQRPTPRRPQGLRVLLGVARFLLPVLVMGGAVYGSILLIGARPTPPRIDRDQRATLVETILPVARPDQAVIIGYGTVEAHRVLTLQPQVGGAVLQVNPSLVAGGLVGTGEVLMQIETQDYELALQQRRAEVANAEVDLQMAEASSLVAQREWELLGETIETSDIGRQLARKEPQRREAEAMLDAARGKLKLAELDLERTTIRAPFNALVLNDSVELGQIVAPRSPVATLVGTDEFEVIASIPLAKIPLVVIDPEDPARNSQATVTLELGDGRTLVRQARVDRLAGEVERSGRLAKVIIQILDPLNREGAPDLGVLLLGSYVRVEIDGPVIEDVIELSRSVLRENDTILVMDSAQRLAVREYTVVLGRSDTVLARIELEPGDRIITSPIGVAIAGMPLAEVGAVELTGQAAPAEGNEGS